MRLFSKAADGGKNSGVTGYFLVECKPLFSIVLLHFAKGTREAFHEHAFDAATLWLKGRVREHHLWGRSKDFRAGQLKVTRRSCFHKIEALQSTWALSIRGPWVDTWRECRKGRVVTLTHGRREVA
jgi:quercetin dioxygenase-like cupin family protein